MPACVRQGERQEENTVCMELHSLTIAIHLWHQVGAASNTQFANLEKKKKKEPGFLGFLSAINTKYIVTPLTIKYLLGQFSARSFVKLRKKSGLY